MTWATVANGSGRRKQIPGKLECTKLRQRNCATAEELLKGQAMLYGVLHSSIRGHPDQVNTPSLMEQIVAVRAHEAVMRICKLAALPFHGKVPTIMEYVHVPVVEVARSERQAPKGFGVGRVELFQLVTQVFSLKHFGRFDVDMDVVLQALFVILCLMPDERPKGDAFRTGKLGELEV